MIDELKTSVGILMVAGPQLRVSSSRRVAGEKQELQNTIAHTLIEPSILYCMASVVFLAIKGCSEMCCKKTW